MNSLMTRSRLFPALNNLVEDVWAKDFFDWSDKNFTALGSTLPSANIVDKPKELSIELAAPGLVKDDFNIEFNNNILTVSCEKQEEKEEKEGTYSRREFSYQSFYRSFKMPENIDEKKIDANYSNGILHVTIGKKKVESPKAVKSIPVK